MLCTAAQWAAVSIWGGAFLAGSSPRRRPRPFGPPSLVERRVAGAIPLCSRHETAPGSYSGAFSWCEQGFRFNPKRAMANFYQSRQVNIKLELLTGLDLFCKIIKAFSIPYMDAYAEF
jgi:hypothetical protein